MTAHELQHWIPQCYTKAWTDPGAKMPMVHLYTAEGFYLYCKHPKHIFAERDLYTLKTKGGERDVKVELALQKLEDQYARIRRRLDRSDPATPRDRAALAYFVAAMRNRSPAARDHWDQFLKRVIDVGDSMARSLREATPEARERMAAISRLPQSGGPAIPLKEFKNMRQTGFGSWLPSHVIAEGNLLAKMRLTIMSCDDAPGFITSDNPVVWWDGVESYRRGNFGLGLGSPHIEVTMPLSPRQCLLFSHDAPAGQCKIASVTRDAINVRTLAHVRERFVANSAELTVDWIA